jgi:hypothetical protein
MLAEKTLNVLRAFSEGKINNEAIELLGFRDYAQLLVALGEANLPLPKLPDAEIERQVKLFTHIWNNS